VFINLRRILAGRVLSKTYYNRDLLEFDLARSTNDKENSKIRRRDETSNAIAPILLTEMGIFPLTTIKFSRMKLLFLGLCLQFVMRPSCPFPTPFHPLELSSYSTLGIMSMVQLPHDDSIPQLVAGTKRNDLLWIQFHRVINDHIEMQIFRFSSREDNASKPTTTTKLLQLPIYSLAFEPISQTLLVGGGDRFVSLWKKHCQNQGHPPSWQKLELKLGPHTGWVKDVTILKHEHRTQLFSIGCNRIEVWSRDMKDVVSSNETWVHAATLSVDTTTALDACTLSSDLLCLAVCTVTKWNRGKNATMDILAAGGVDGRIHVFGIPQGKEPMSKICSIAAHDGRVNSLCWDPNNSFLYSIGHDGCVCCWSIDKHHNLPDDNPFQQIGVRMVTKLSLTNERTTAMACLNSAAKNKLAVGTHNGSIYFLSLECVCNKWELVCTRKHAVECYEECPIITSLCLLHFPGQADDDDASVTSILIVGHSLGMGYIIV
jgi:WD40 repeat protein